MKAPRLGLTMGCPSGIGPEICARVACETRLLVIGDVAVMRRAAKIVGVKLPVVAANDPGDPWRRGAARAIYVVEPGAAALTLAQAPFGKATRAGGRAQLAYVDAAIDLAMRSEIDALVTAPVSKSAVAMTLPSFVGHTEHMQRCLRAREVVMAFWHPKLTTALVTNHEPLARVPRAITAARVAAATYWLASFLAAVGHTTPRIVVCSLNPHAGEGGLFGREERSKILPGIVLAKKRLRASGLRAVVTGPTGAESAFRHAQDGFFEGVVAMYHDQATIPMKLVGFGEAVNVSLGLPLVRTSVDHGTAYDIAGNGIADARGLRAAVKLAIRLCQRR